MKARPVEGLDPKRPVGPNAARIVRVRLEELRSLAPAALEPGASAAQHDLRIAAKRLRYVLEILAPCVGADAAAARDAAKRLQSVLGDLHDCDEMLTRVEGVESLEGLLRTRCELLFRRFVELWHEDAETWRALEQGASTMA